MSGFTKVPNDVLRDATLSLQAKALYALIASKPVSWDFSGRRLAEESSNGFDALNRALHELEHGGWLVRRKLPSGKAEWNLCNPNSDNPNQANPSSENQNQGPNSENPKLGKSQVGKTSTISNTQDKVRLKGSKTVIPPSPQRGMEDLQLIQENNCESLLHEIAKILRPGCRADRPKKEQSAFRAIKPTPTQAEVEQVAHFYRLPKSKTYDSTWSRKQEPITLLRDWPNQVELAEQHLSAGISSSDSQKDPNSKPAWLQVKELKSQLEVVQRTIENDPNFRSGPVREMFSSTEKFEAAQAKYESWRDKIFSERRHLTAELGRLEAE